ncbi:putative origin recognition complex, subunit 5-like protein [Roridomyces roridus]|uniref:Origin recognition complex, subunit 5-like protein n=1 Tax=Roridomyces roridus TaxID=1738132 RepID=A0AAD7BHY6_9AGAR|nr:putative origin recognition complex, subunit 5-like protein [Roridomyces roridus]
MSSETAGYEQLAADISSIFSARAPPFVYVNDPVSPRTTASVVNSVLSTLANASSFRVNHAQVNAVACFTPRILYDTIINQLAGWTVKWEEGCTNWGEERWNDSLDGFFHGLKAVKSHNRSSSSKKGKAKQMQEDLVDEEDAQIVIVVERAERLQEMADLVVPLTRLAELTDLQLSVVFISEVPWEDMRPAFGGSPDPYYVDVAPLNKEALERRLLSAFDRTSSQIEEPNPYHPTLRPFYAQFISVLLDSCLLYVQDPNELQYIAAARWPGFVQPVLDAYKRRGEDVDMDTEHDDSGLSLPREDVRMRLIRIFKPSFAAALNTLYPRLDHATNWAASNCPEADLLMKPPNQTQPLPGADGGEVDAAVGDDKIGDLPRMSKFLLVAAYLASTNPANKDLRMFGRGLDEKKRKRRAYRTARGGGTAKPPQRVLGPNPFPLDRLIAIFGALLEENDVDNRLPAPEYTIPGERTDIESARVGTYNTIVELSDIGLLHRTSAPDKLDAPTFKCGISYLTAAALARQLDVPLNDLLWDPA